MLYLLAASWEWLAAAAALGLIVGFLAVDREKGAIFSGHGVVVTSAALLVGGFFLSNMQTIPGRAGLLFDLGLLFAAAYGLALPIGGGARLLAGGAAPDRPAKKKPPHVVVRGAPKPRAEPASPPEPEVEPEIEEPAAPAAAVASIPEPAASIPPEPAPEPAAKPRAAPPAEPKKTPGARPEGLPGPRGGRPDDLSKIKGVGPKSVEKLHSLGVYHFDQIAAWTPDNVKWMSATLAAPGRLEKGRWVAQAKELAEAAHPGSGEAQ